MISRSFAGSIASTRLEGHCERKENKIQVARFSVFIPRNTPTVTPLNVNEQDNESSEKAGEPSPVGRPTVGSSLCDGSDVDTSAGVQGPSCRAEEEAQKE